MKLRPLDSGDTTNSVTILISSENFNPFEAAIFDSSSWIDPSSQ
jgi:hypothetical protein